MVKTFRVGRSLATMLAFCATGCRRHTDLRARVEARLVHQLPVGSTPEQALRLLDSARVVHSRYLPGDDRIITANFGESYRMLLVSSSVYVTLHYDPSDRLTSRDVEEIGTGP